MRQDCKNFSLHPLSNNLRENFRLKKNYSFIDFVRASREKFSAWLSKLDSTFPEGHSARKILWENFFHINILWAAVGFFLYLIVKTAFYFIWGTMWENFFWKKTIILEFFFDFGWKIFKMIIKTAFWFSWWTFWENPLLKWTYNFVLFSVFRRKFSGRILRTALYNFRKTFLWKRLTEEITGS